jgi:cyclophilin family peptidyl-prolyl cis-trans isomerase
MKNKKLILLGIVSIVVVAGLAAWMMLRRTPSPAPGEPPGSVTKTETPTPNTPKAEGGNMLVIETDGGTVEIELYPEDAPKTVARIKELAQKGFYDGLTFHRVVPGFVVQGGDPKGDGTGGSGQNLPAEFNKRQHVDGTLAMARAADPNSADSQFYIALARIPYLDGQYTIFGQVTKGLDIVHKIKIGDKMKKVTVK